MRLLVVEDDPDLNRQLVSALTDAGYAVDTAFDGEEGHFLGDTEPYDAVVLDIGLPKIDGLEATRALKTHEKTRSIPVVITTSHAMKGDRRRAVEVGCDAYITKPIDTRTFARTVRGVIEGRGEGASVG